MSRGLLWEQIASPLPDTKAYQHLTNDGTLRVIVGQEEAGWHLSISFAPIPFSAHPLRYPTWDEIKDARYRFVPDRVTMAQLLPPRAEFVNVHPTTFHLWEVSSTLGEQG